MKSKKKNTQSLVRSISTKTGLKTEFVSLVVDEVIGEIQQTLLDGGTICFTGLLSLSMVENKYGNFKGLAGSPTFKGAMRPKCTWSSGFRAELRKVSHHDN